MGDVSATPYGADRRRFARKASSSRENGKRGGGRGCRNPPDTASRLASEFIAAVSCRAFLGRRI
jgi:hypothetical protein